MKFGNEIAVVNNKIINIIKRMIEGGYTPKSEDYFSKGDFVIVIDGPQKVWKEVLNESAKND